MRTPSMHLRFVERHVVIGGVMTDRVLKILQQFIWDENGPELFADARGEWVDVPIVKG